LTSTLTFTQLLNEPDLEVSDQSTWIYAVGLPNNQWTGKHNIRGEVCDLLSPSSFGPLC
jgi:hypothetical protein